MKRLALIVSSLLVLTACDNAQSGYVQSKQFHPSYVTFDYMCTSYDSKTFACNVPIYTPRDVPECYELNFYNKEDDEYGHACVDPNMYKDFSIGMHYPNSK